MKVMHLTLESWQPHQDPIVWKQDPDGLESDLSEDNLVGEAEEYLGKITGMPRKGAVAEKGKPNTVRAAQHCFYDLQFIKWLNRDKDPMLQHVQPNKIVLARYGLGDAYKGGFGSGLSMPKEGSDGMEDVPGRVHARHGVWYA